MSLHRLTLFIVAALAMTDAAAAAADAVAELYGVFEGRVENPQTYANPFDFRVIELKTEFTAPSGRKVSFFGFFDGDGNGVQSGNVWKFRYMPDEVGAWSYAYSWSDGTAGGKGEFTVEDRGARGPLRIAADNPMYFEDSRGNPFDARPYGMHHYLVWSPTHRMAAELARFKETVQAKVIDQGYNLVMWPDMGDRLQAGASARPPSGRATDSWWHDTKDTNRFSLAAFAANDEALTFCREQGVYVIPFSGMVDQGSQYDLDDFRVFVRYFVARMAPHGNYFGWSPVWEWMDIWKPADVSKIMGHVHELDPWKRPLTAHDCSHSTFAEWLAFSMRQRAARDIFLPNSRRAGQQQIADPQGSGGIGNPFIDRPIIGSEDQWESPNTDDFPGWVMPRNGVETMRSCWGTLMAGVIPFYDEWNAWTVHPGRGKGEPYVRRMFDFWYSHTQYRKHQPLNRLVWREEQQIASGIPGQEFVVYDQDGGVIHLNLSETPQQAVFNSLWFDPASGTEIAAEPAKGKSYPRFKSPFDGDSVLLLKRRE